MRRRRAEISWKEGGEPVAEKKGIKIAAQNRKAHHDYFVEDRYEAGIELFGTEVKSIRAGTLNLKDSYCIAKIFKFRLVIFVYSYT